jgi:hypothetical protein
MEVIVQNILSCIQKFLNKELNFQYYFLRCGDDREN